MLKGLQTDPRALNPNTDLGLESITNPLVKKTNGRKQADANTEVIPSC